MIQLRLSVLLMRIQLKRTVQQSAHHVIEQVKLALQKRGVIIFTDPDYPGERIRKIISDKVPGCKHAFYRRKKHLLRGKKVSELNMLLMNQFAVL